MSDTDDRVRTIIAQRAEARAERDRALEAGQMLLAQRDTARGEVKRSVETGRTLIRQRREAWTERDRALSEVERLKGLLADPNYIAALYEIQERETASE